MLLLFDAIMAVLMLFFRPRAGILLLLDGAWALGGALI